MITLPCRTTYNVVEQKKSGEKMKCCKRIRWRKKKIITSSCTYVLSKLIRANFSCGDIIGLTFIEDGVASIATGIFQKIVGPVVVVKDLLLEDTTSFVPLCDVSSVEKGIIGNGSSQPLSVKLN